MASLNDDDIKALEQTRQRLVQIANSLQSLQSSMVSSDPLPSWNSIHTQTTIISQNFTSLNQHLLANASRFRGMVSFPLPDFPARTQENLLGQLLRKKLEPDVEDWVKRGRETAMKSAEVGKTTGDEEKKQNDKDELPLAELNRLWQGARPVIETEMDSKPWGDNYTEEERRVGIEKAITGLRRNIDALQLSSKKSDENAEEAVEEGEADPDAMEVVNVRRKSGAAGVEFEVRPGGQSTAMPPTESPSGRPIADIFRFQMTGAESGGIFR